MRGCEKASSRVASVEFGEIVPGVAEVVLRVLADQLNILVRDGTADACGDTCDQGARRNAHAFRDESTGGDDAFWANEGSIENDGSHTDQNVVSERAAVDDGVVSDRAAIADDDGELPLHSMKDGAVLDVTAAANTDGVDVSAENSVHPDRGVFTEGDIADDLGGNVDVT
jgi:hypothetical protein